MSPSLALYDCGVTRASQHIPYNTNNPYFVLSNKNVLHKIKKNFKFALCYQDFLLTYPIADVPEPGPKGILLGVLAPVKECALATLLFLTYI